MATVKKNFCEYCSHCEICSVKEEYNRVCCMIENSIVAVGYIDKYKISVECPHYSQKFVSGTVRTAYDLSSECDGVSYATGTLWNNVYAVTPDGITATVAETNGALAYSDSAVETTITGEN